MKRMNRKESGHTDGAVDHPLRGRAVARGFGTVWGRRRHHTLNLAHVHVGWWGRVRLLRRRTCRQMARTPHLIVPHLQGIAIDSDQISRANVLVGVVPVTQLVFDFPNTWHMHN